MAIQQRQTHTGIKFSKRNSGKIFFLSGYMILYYCLQSFQQIFFIYLAKKIYICFIVTIMQGSRFSRLGKQTLKNRTNFTLMQQINPQQFLNDRPLKNTSTLYLDQNGKQTQLTQLKASSFKSKDNQKLFTSDQSNQMQQSNVKDMYALPIVHSNTFGEYANKSRFSKKLIRSQYMTQRPALDSIRQVNNSDVYNQTGKQKNRGKLLSIKRPKGFLKRGQKFQDIDFIGDNLYEVEDIISDIGKIMDHTKRKNVVLASVQPKNPIKGNKWLSNHFGGLSKLDEMLLNYKSVRDQNPSIPILQNFYRQSKGQQQKKQKNIFKAKMNSFNNLSLDKSNQHKLSLVVIKWNQMPMIATKWQPDVFLKLQSYPQQEQYRKVVLKAYSMQVRSYSIFLYHDAGIITPQKFRQNDKNTTKKKLMSEQQYAKAWEQKYPQNDNTLSEQEKEVLMQFDIEWYRTIIQFCYYSGLEDLLEKQYDVEKYVQVMSSLERDQQVSAQNIINNQMKYLLQYFTKMYSFSVNQTTLGIIRINNDENMKIQELYTNFNSMLIGNNEQNRKVQFCIWPLTQDKSNLVVLLQLCGDTSKQHFQIKKSQKIIVQMKQPHYTIQIVQQNTMIKQQKNKREQEEEQERYRQQQDQEQEQENKENKKLKEKDIKKLIIKNKEDNDWDVYMKLHNNQKTKPTLKLSMVQELLFGILYKVSA